MARRRTRWYAAQGIVKSGEARAEKDRFLLDDSEDVVFSHHQKVITINLNFGAGILAEQHHIANLDIQRQDFTFFSLLAIAAGYDLSALRFLFCGFRDEKSPLGFGFFFDPLDEDAVLKRS